MTDNQKAVKQFLLRLSNSEKERLLAYIMGSKLQCEYEFDDVPPSVDQMHMKLEEWYIEIAKRTKIKD